MARPELETERLRFRQFRESDLDPLIDILSHPEVAPWLGGGKGRAEVWLTMARMLGHWELRGYGMWAVEEKASGALIGRIGFNHSEGMPDFELGWTLGRPYWGRGYATEGAREALAFAFRELGRERVIHLIDPKNKRSVAVAERIGSKAEGTHLHHGTEVFVYAARPVAEPR